MAQIAVDVVAQEFARLGHDFARVPSSVKTVVFARAFKRVGDMTRTRVIRTNAKRINIPQKHVRARTSRPYGTGDQRSIKVRSAWISLGELGAKPTARGVVVRGRGSYQSAFMAKMGSGHVNAFRRVGKARLPINKLFGPNPANDIATSPEFYADILQEVMRSHMAKRMLHELSRVLPD